MQCDGENLESGILNLDVAPQKKAVVRFPFKKPVLKEGAEYRLLVSFHLKEKTMWAGKGFEIAWDQLELPWRGAPAAVNEVSVPAPDITEASNRVIISGKDFSYTFDRKNGLLVSVKVKGKELIRKGPELNVWRAPLANETDEWNYNRSNTKHRITGYGHVAASEWYSSGLDKLEKINENFSVSKEEGNALAIEIKNTMMLGTGQGSFTNKYKYTIYGSGEMTIDHSIFPDGDLPAWLPRIGVDWIFDKSLGNVEWYGRGPQENYPDRKSGYKTGVYKSTVKEMYEPYLIPQDYGLRTDNRWVRMTDDNGTGLEFSGDELFNFSAQPYSTENLTRALYTYQLHPFDGVTFNFDYATSGVGCTAISVFPAYQVMPSKYDFRVTIKPVF